MLVDHYSTVRLVWNLKLLLRESSYENLERLCNSCATKVWGILGNWKVTFGKRILIVSALPPAGGTVSHGGTANLRVLT